MPMAASQGAGDYVPVPASQQEVDAWWSQEQAQQDAMMSSPGHDEPQQ